jgi:hypothetical protein
MKSEGAQLVGCVAFGLAVALVLAAGYVFDASGALNVEVHYGAGFFPEERWGPGKARRWMQQAGEVELLSEGNPGHVDVGFYAESFRVPRTIQVALSGDVLGTFRVPAGAQTFHVIRGVRLKPGGDRAAVSEPGGPGSDQRVPRRPGPPRGYRGLGVVAGLGQRERGGPAHAAECLSRVGCGGGISVRGREPGA